MYPPLVWQILRRKVTQNLASFLLWGMLDAVAAASIIFQKGNWYLPAAYVLGCIAVVTSLVIVKTWAWTNFETFVSFLVVICLIGWAISGPRLATILSTTGVVLAGIPQLIDTYKKPDEQPLLSYFGFTIANTLGVLGGAAWTIEERLYPAACVVLCGAVWILCFRKYFTRKPEWQRKAMQDTAGIY
jgi:hypothetical protein